MTRRIVLASTSPYRRELLARLGLEFTVAAPGVDEDATKALGLSPRDLVARLASAKAHAVADGLHDAIVIGSDQCGDLDGVVLDKPGTPERARAQLGAMAGRSHRLWTGVALLDVSTGRELLHVDEHRLTMRPLDAEAIARYVASDDPVACAGSYKIESLGITLFERIEGDDFTAIMGLPLTAVTRMLDALGVRVP